LQEPERNPVCTQCQCKRCRCRAWVTRGIEIIGVLVLTGYTWFTYGLLSESQKQTELAVRSAKYARRSFELSQRPILAVGSVELCDNQPTTSIEPCAGVIEADNPHLFRLTFTNVGKGPAREIVAELGWGLTNSNTVLQFARAFPAGPLRLSVLSPGDKPVNDVRIAVSDALSPEEVKSIQRPGGDHFVVMIWVKYVDLLGPESPNHYVSETCWWYNGGARLLEGNCPSRR
jgi:hypothetical protein